MRNYVTTAGDTLALVATQVYGSSVLWKELLDDNPELGHIRPTDQLEGHIVLRIREGALEYLGLAVEDSPPASPYFSSQQQQELARARYPF